jgi:excisionase family DNA binding protein
MSNESKQILFVTDEQQLRRIIREEMQATNKGHEKKVTEFSERMDRKEAARFLGIQYASMYNWVRDGKIREHGTGRKRFYYKNELIQALENADKD